ncbi:MAG: ChbG/HpnK family deacetylase [Siculibacillus sp.]
MCADDFGHSEDVDVAVIDLAERGRLTAAGCMVGGPAFAADAPRLVALADRIDMGLHFALTDFLPLGPMPGLTDGARPPSLKTVLTRALTGRLPYEEIKAEIGRQVGRFREITGRDPDFVDGHQHVHVFPTVRAALFACFDEGVLDARRTWLRDCAESPIAAIRRGIEVPKVLFISALSAGFGRAARRRGIRVNDGFRGITAFDPAQVERLFPKFLEGEGRAPLVMCHPATTAIPAPAGDPIAAARRAEWAYLASERFAADLARAEVSPARPSTVFANA